jgi:large conductance mechanosensitive channel
MIKGFKDFLLRGNVVDLAVAVVVGAAFGAIITQFTGGIIQPVINSLGSTKSAGLGFFIRDGKPSTYVDFSAVITSIINFAIVAAVVYFVIVLPVNALMERRKRGEEAEVAAPGEEVVLLQEIRDLLRERST